MTVPVVPRAAARRDVEEAVDYYRRKAGERVALAFIDQLESAYQILAAHPASGSPRVSYELNLPELRCFGLRRYPYLVFYRDLADRIDVWRVLHAKRDVPGWMFDRLS